MLLPSSLPPAPSPFLPSGNPRVELLPPHPVVVPSGDSGSPEPSRCRYQLLLELLFLPTKLIEPGVPALAGIADAVPFLPRSGRRRASTIVSPSGHPCPCCPFQCDPGKLEFPLDILPVPFLS